MYTFKYICVPEGVRGSGGTPYPCPWNPQLSARIETSWNLALTTEQFVVLETRHKKHGTCKH